MKQTSEELQRENGQLKHIFTSISKAPETEAFEALRRVGAQGDNPLLALGAVVDAGFLRQPITTVDGEVKRIDNEALAESRHKLPAKPWTSVAGDGLVSHLISDYLSRDEQDPFVHCLLLLDSELFLRDMKRGDLANSQFCSPFLVNTICGLRSLFSERVRQINAATGTDLTKRFAAEAKKHFEIEADKRRVTTLQSLYYFFLFTCHLSTNRAGSLYRLAALDYIQNSDVEKVVLMKPRSSNPEDANKRRALFKTYWAIFNFECILCSTYLKAPAIKGLPLTPLPSYGPDTILNPVNPLSLLPPPNSFPSVNEISHLQYRAMSYNMKPQMPVGEEPDVVPRRHLLYELSQLEGRLIPVPHDMYTEDSIVIQTKVYLDMVAYNVLRPLPSMTTIHVGDTITTARAHLLALATTDITLMHTYLTKRATPQYSPAIVIPLWSAVFTFIPFLDDISTHAAFTSGCALLHDFERNMHGIRTFRRGVLAVSWRIGMPLPQSALQYLEGLEDEVRTGQVELREVPVDFVIALPREVLTRVLGKEGENAGGLDLGAVLGEWGEELLRTKLPFKQENY
ncbi:hypothetical protein B0J18DRAFT_447034 [Chaetomium sp. MPI-SDFR-AT-0129]|nr:hypothetical protein B0J18DRAFT_447034 [Chaetomium sp. MPI-SDFR-AT-0129]